MNKKSILKFQNVSKIIGNTTIINQLNFEVYEGDIFGFLGKNGAGKTTTIRMILGLMKIDKDV